MLSLAKIRHSSSSSRSHSSGSQGQIGQDWLDKGIDPLIAIIPAMVITWVLTTISILGTNDELREKLPQKLVEDKKSFVLIVFALFVATTSMLLFADLIAIESPLPMYYAVGTFVFIFASVIVRNSKDKSPVIHKSYCILLIAVYTLAFIASVVLFFVMNTYAFVIFVPVGYVVAALPLVFRR